MQAEVRPGASRPLRAASGLLPGLEAGADRYLAKAGYSEQALLEAVHDLIGPP